MKRTLYLCGVMLLLAGWAGAQSLGELARQQRQQKRPSATKVYTNDDIPSAANPAPTVDTSTKKEEGDADKDKKDAKSDKAKAAEAFQKKVDDLKKEIAQLERELSVNDREYRLRAATFYADAGNSLRDPKKWAEEDRKYKAEREEKQKALDAAKQKLADLLEQARKAGLRVE